MKQASEHDLHLGKWLGGAALGALLMYMMDPDRGAPRRARSGETLRDLGKQTGDTLEKVVRHIGHRSGDSASGTDAPMSDSAARGTADPAHSQGESTQPESTQLPWQSPSRTAAMLGGTTLGLAGMLARRGPLAMLVGIAGVGMLMRAVGKRPLPGMAKPHGQHDTRDIEKTVDIEATPEQVYDLWANYDNLPRFMAKVVDVRDLGERRSHWIVKGPEGGSDISFDAVLTEQVRPRRLAWQSENESGGAVRHACSVLVEPSHGGTRTTVRLSYRPPAGAPDEIAATPFGADPEHELEEDLARMKNLIEGALPPAAGQPSESRAFH